eukprot:m.1639258 g.1639258  ORF g.1639258 m.1639258 type:complete len:624 (+) comp34183_c0_seq1:239-2110(+)
MESVPSSACEAFTCSITMDIMSDPVMAPDGRSYERNAITRWLQTHGTSPVTREPMEVASLISNRALKDAIEHWRSQLPRQHSWGGSTATAQARKQVYKQYAEGKERTSLQVMWAIMKGMENARTDNNTTYDIISRNKDVRDKVFKDADKEYGETQKYIRVLGNGMSAVGLVVYGVMLGLFERKNGPELYQMLASGQTWDGEDMAEEDLALIQRKVRARLPVFLVTLLAGIGIQVVPAVLEKAQETVDAWVKAYETEAPNETTKETTERWARIATMTLLSLVTLVRTALPIMAIVRALLLAGEQMGQTTEDTIGLMLGTPTLFEAVCGRRGASGAKMQTRWLRDLNTTVPGIVERPTGALAQAPNKLQTLYETINTVFTGNNVLGAAWAVGTTAWDEYVLDEKDSGSIGGMYDDMTNGTYTKDMLACLPRVEAACVTHDVIVELSYYRIMRDAAIVLIVMYGTNTAPVFLKRGCVFSMLDGLQRGIQQQARTLRAYSGTVLQQMFGDVLEIGFRLLETAGGRDRPGAWIVDALLAGMSTGTLVMESKTAANFASDWFAVDNLNMASGLERFVALLLVGGLFVWAEIIKQLARLVSRVYVKRYTDGTHGFAGQCRAKRITQVSGV